MSVLAVIGSSIWTWTIEQVDGLDWIFFQFKLDKTGHGLLIFGSYLDSFYLDMDFDPFPGVYSSIARWGEAALFASSVRAHGTAVQAVANTHVTATCTCRNK